MVFEFVRAFDVLEIGVGCGFVGLMVVCVGVKCVCIIDGVLGVIDVIVWSVSELLFECVVIIKVMFLDFRDDDDILAGVVSFE